MTGAKYRSGSWKKKFVNRADGLKIIYKRERNTKSRCICGRLLSGVKTVGKKTEKTVSRKYGGRFCAKCARRLVIEGVRGAR